MMLLFSVTFAQAATKTSIGTGNWNTATIWDSGVPGAADNAIVNTSVTIDNLSTVTVNDLTINTGTGKLVVDGTLIVNGNLTMDFSGNNESELLLSPGCRVIVNGNVDLGNKVSLALSSYFIVGGNFNKQGSANQGAISISGAHIYIFGTVNIPWTNFSTCGGAYSGTTTVLDDPCDYGNLDALVTNNVASVIPEVFIEKNNITPLSACFCAGGNATLTIGETSSISWLKWYNGTTLLSTNTSPTSPYTYTAYVAGSYSAIYKAGNQLYRTNSVAVTTSPSIPATPGSITGNAIQCPGLTLQTYSIAAVPNTNIYNWSVPTGWTITAGAETNSITVTTGSAGQNGNISVTAGNCCGVSASRLLAVTVWSSPSATVSGTTTVCQNAVAPNVTFTNPMAQPITVTYNINGSNQTTINIGANATATVAVPTTTSGSFEYNLVSVVYQTSPTCSNAITGTATINVMPLVHTNKITKL